MRALLLLALLPSFALAQADRVRVCDKTITTQCAEVASDGTLKVTTSAGGGATFGNAFPATGTAAGAKVITGTPSYTVGTMQAPTLTTAGELRIAGTISASSSATATAAPPTYGEGSSQPFSQDLAGWLRTRSLHTTAASPMACRISDGSSFFLPLTDTQLRASAVPVSGTFWQATQPVSGPLTDAQLRAVAVPISGTFWQATQPVSAAALPLPAGASTEGTLSTLNGKVPSGLTVTATRLLVDGSGVTQPVSGTVTATGPLTDAQLRASAVPTTDAHTTAAAPLSCRLSDGAAFYTAGGGGGGTSSSYGAAFPATGTAAGFSDGTNMVLARAGATNADAEAVLTAGALEASSHLMGYNGTTWDRVRTANTGRLQVDVVTGGGSNGSVSSVASATPASATFAGAKVVSSAPSYTNGNLEGVTLDTAGNLRTGITTIDTVQSACVLNALNSTCAVTMAGKSSVGMVETATSSPTGIILTPEFSLDNTSWVATYFDDPATGAKAATIPNATHAVGITRTLVGVGAGGFARVRASSWTSGSVTVTVRASDVDDPTLLASGAPGALGAPPTALQVAAQDATTATTLNALKSGALNTTPGAVPWLLTADGVSCSAVSAVTAGNVAVASFDSVTGAMNVRLTDSSTYLAPSVLANDTTAIANGLGVQPAVARAAPTAVTAGRGEMLQIDTVSGGVFDTPATTTHDVGTTSVTYTANTALNVKASAGNVYGISAINAAASVCWLQFYNTAGTPTCGTSVVWSVPLPVTPGVFNLPPGAFPLRNHATGIGICVSTTATGGTTCGSASSGTIFFK